VSVEQANTLRDAADVVRGRGYYELSYQLHSVASELMQALADKERETTAQGAWD
jgi:hypothetical protein